MKSQQIQNRIAQLEDNIAELKKELAKAKEIKLEHLQVYRHPTFNLDVAILEDVDGETFSAVWVDDSDRGRVSVADFPRAEKKEMEKTLKEWGGELIGTLELTIKPL